VAKPTKQSSLELARQIKSTIVPVEHKPLRRPYKSTAAVRVVIEEDQASSTAAEHEEAIVPFASVHERAKFRASFFESEETNANGKKATVAPPAKAKPNPQKVHPPQAKFPADLVKRMIKNHLQQWRPPAWEDDISRNTLDENSFANLIAPADLPIDAFYASEELSDFVEQLVGREELVEMIARDRLPIPSAPDREGYSPGYDGVYWMSGLNDYLKVSAIAEKYQLSPESCLDFGCATGRVLRHFAVQSKCKQVWGTDINARHIRWLEQYMPQHVRPVFNHAIPSLPIADSSVDVITAFSVFTHIDTFESSWLAELNRILSRNGICYLTVHNEDTWRVLRDEIDNPNNRLVQSIMKIDPDFGSALKGEMPDKRTVYRFTDFGPYRAQVFHSNNYLKKVWGRFFNVREIIPCHHVRQTVVVLQK
jgi:ubiquinone/menaquinone biosynthesis C-methylase UbiE